MSFKTYDMIYFEFAYVFERLDSRLRNLEFLTSLVLKLALDQYLEISNILKNPRQLDDETIEQFKHDIDVIKEWI